MLNFIGDGLIENKNVVYKVRFCQLIFTQYCPDVPIFEDEVINYFQLHKRAFKDLIRKDFKKAQIKALRISN